MFSNPNHCLIPSPPKTPSPASVIGVAARPWKKRNHRIRCLKTPSQEDRQWIQQCQPRTHQETSAQPLVKNFALLSQHSMLAASGSPGQHQPAGTTGWQRPISMPTAVGSTSIRYAHCQQQCLQCVWGKRKGLHSRKKQTPVLSLESPVCSVKNPPFICADIYFCASSAKLNISSCSLNIGNFVYS